MGLKNLATLLVWTASVGGLATPARGADGNAIDWEIQQIDRGTKPALALNSKGWPTIVYMLERMDGWVKVAVWDGSAWNLSAVDAGYFYGPTDLAIDSKDIPHIIYHDHQDTRFNPNKGDAVHSSMRNGAWVKDTLSHSGHDGWDTRVTVDNQGQAHVSAIDPSDFGGGGVEYYRINPNGDLKVEEIGSGPQTYMYATSIAVNPAGEPLIAYYDQTEKSLRLGRRLDGGKWEIETVDKEGNTGLFSSMLIDQNGAIHISYLERTGTSTGRIKYAVRRTGSNWEISQVDTLSRIVTGFTGARNLTSLVLDSQGHPWMAYSDEQDLRLAIFDGAKWQIEGVARAETNPFGQIVSLKLDAQDAPHIAYATVTDKQVLDGFIFHASVRRPTAITLRNLRRGDGTFEFSFATVGGRTYLLQYKNALSDAQWTTGETVLGDGAEHQVVVSTAENSARFYRAMLK